MEHLEDITKNFQHLGTADQLCHQLRTGSPDELDLPTLTSGLRDKRECGNFAERHVYLLQR